MSNKMIGIIAEWNPFHKGHEYLISTLREQVGDAPILAAMSGSFVQRGEPSLFDKWTRAGWALEGGVDIVIELPTLCVIQSADIFAERSVKLLAASGCRGICFGSESLGKEELLDAASFSLTSLYLRHLHKGLDDGLSYADAAYEAMKEHSKALADELKKPNNLLGFRYVESILRHRYDMDIYVIHRSEVKNMSATRARENLISSGRCSLLPSYASKEAIQLMKEGRYTDYKRYEDSCLLLSRLMTKDELEETRLFTEGLDNKWFKESQSKDYSTMLMNIKSKRYLYSRLKRISAALLLSNQGPSIFTCPIEPSYARILGLRKEKSSLINDIHLPVVTSIAKALRTLPKEALASLKIDVKATDIFSYCQTANEYRASRLDFYEHPIIL